MSYQRLTGFAILTCAFAAVLALASDLRAATYYVAPNGNDKNPGTSSKPWASPAYGSRRMKSGDTLIIRKGHYIISVYDDDIMYPPRARRPPGRSSREKTGRVPSSPAATTYSPPSTSPERNIFGSKTWRSPTTIKSAERSSTSGPESQSPAPPRARSSSKSSISIMSTRAGSTCRMSRTSRS